MYERHVYLGEWSEVGPEQSRTTLTTNAIAARTLGVEPLSMETLPRQTSGTIESPPVDKTAAAYGFRLGGRWGEPHPCCRSACCDVHAFCGKAL